MCEIPDLPHTEFSWKSNANLPALQKGTLVPLPPPSTSGTGIWDFCSTDTHAIREGSEFDFDTLDKALR